jgi:hypothetical protein
MSNQRKNKYWCAVLYPENMVDNWQEEIDHLIQVPYAYCVHDKDKDANGDKRKTHIHLIYVFPNTTTYNHALTTVQKLGKKAVNTCEPIIGIRHYYDYLIHATEKAKKDKHQYDPSERIEGNNFDIGAYEQLTAADKIARSQEIADLIAAEDIYNFFDLYLIVMDKLGKDYYEILMTQSGFFERLCRGLFHKQSYEAQKKAHEKAHEEHPKCCSNCGSIDIIKKGKTASEQQRYFCKDCERTFIL